MKPEDTQRPASHVTLDAGGAGLLTEITTRIAGGEPMAQIFAAIVTGVERKRSNLICSIILLDDERRLRVGAAPNLPSFYNDAIEGLAIGPQVGSCGTAAYLNQRIVVDDIATDPLWADYKGLAAQAGLGACWSEPIRGGAGRVLGTFAMYQMLPGFPSEQDISLIAAAAHLAAITIERDQAKGALVQSEDRARRAVAGQQASARDLESFFSVSPDLLCITTLAGDFIRVNRAWTTMLGHQPDDLIGRNFSFLLHPDDVESTAVVVGGLGRSQPEVIHTNRFRCADGGYKPIEWRASLSTGALYCIGRDVTERLAAEAEMLEAREAAEAANRAKSDFLANMSHEVRTPLNGVIGIVDALARTPLTPAQADMVELIRSSGATLERLVSDILDVSKIEAGRLELELREFDLDQALDGVLEVARIRADDKAIAFRVEQDANARGRFCGDAVRLKQILDNLLSNAVKFTVAGEIVVRVEVIDAPRHGEAARLVLTVADTGVGFDPALAAGLFERFSQADGSITRRFGGTGLGLSISKALAEMMGGRISVQSEPGVGSRFTVDIPLSRVQDLADYDRPRNASAALDQGDAVPSALSDDRALRILLAEDNPTNQKVVSLILSPMGVDLTIVGNGALAVEAYRAGDFDLILMDMQMPVLDGLAATRVLRTLEKASPGRARTPIAMLSANAMPHHCDEAATAGADLHIAKPVTARALIEGVEQALALGEAARADQPRNSAVASIASTSPSRSS